ncbi:MAG: type II secretion system F family protein, partial [Coraliomargarita sp.]
CSVALVVVVIFLTVLLPQIQGMLDQLGGEMTMSAKILIGGADFLIAYGPYVIALLIVGAIAFERWRKTDKGLSTTDRWLLKLPLLGKIILLSDLFQSGNLVSTLLESGINTTETLRLTERTIKNTELRERFHNARGQINEGLGISQAFKRNQFMPDLSLDILAVGENTGNLAHSMDEVTRGFRDELTKRLTGLTAMVSTAALVTAFLMVALIAMGIITSVMAVSRELSM